MEKQGMIYEWIGKPSEIAYEGLQVRMASAISDGYLILQSVEEDSALDLVFKYANLEDFSKEWKIVRD